MIALTLLLDAALVAAAALYLWALAAFLHTPVIWPVQRWLRRGWRWPLVSCPWCSGWWLALGLLVAVQWGRWDWVTSPVVALAAAALVGVVASNWMPPAAEPEDD